MAGSLMHHIAYNCSREISCGAGDNCIHHVWMSNVGIAIGQVAAKQMQAENTLASI